MEKVIKYIEIFEYYKNKIINKEMIYKERLPTEQEIGEIFSVSRHTVRQAILELEREGYIYRERSKGAFVENIKENKKSKMIIVITTYVSEYIFPFLITGIEEVLSQRGYDILLLSTNNDKEKEKEQLKKLLKYDVVGAIIEPTTSALGNTNIEYYEEISNNNIPYLMINAAYEKDKQSYIAMDDEKGGYIICKYLIDSGHKKIAGLFKEDDIQGIERKSGYLKALEENNIKIDSTIIGGFKTFEEDFYISGFITSLLSKSDRPTAVVCYNDKVAMNVIKIAKKIGINVPEDLSVVGYDNDDTISAALDCGITTILHPKEELGRKAAEMLLALIEKDIDKVSYVFEPKLKIKNSVKKLYD